jgi:hypothetical protein
MATLFLAKSVSFDWPGGVPDSRLAPRTIQRAAQRGCVALAAPADHSGGTVADFHGLPNPRASSIVGGKCKLVTTPSQSNRSALDARACSQRQPRNATAGADSDPQNEPGHHRREPITQEMPPGPIWQNSDITKTNVPVDPVGTAGMSIRNQGWANGTPVGDQARIDTRQRLRRL